LAQEQFEKQFGAQQEQFAQQLGLQREQLTLEDARLKTQQQQFKIQSKLEDAKVKLAEKDFDFRKQLSADQMELADQAANLALDQFAFEQKTEIFNAFSSIANQMNKDLTEDQAKIMIGLFGPDLLAQMVDSGFSSAGDSGGGESELERLRREDIEKQFSNINFDFP
jgi:hypothetical protein